MEQEIENEFDKLERLVGEYFKGCKAMMEVGWLEEPSQELIACLKHHGKITTKDMASEAMKYLANSETFINALVATCLDELRFMPDDYPSPLRFVGAVMINFIYDELPKYHRWHQYGLAGRMWRYVDMSDVSNIVKEYKKARTCTTMQISKDVESIENNNCLNGGHKVFISSYGCSFHMDDRTIDEKN